jgi:hypothetical protein
MTDEEKIQEVLWHLDNPELLRQTRDYADRLLSLTWDRFTGAGWTKVEEEDYYITAHQLSEIEKVLGKALVKKIDAAVLSSGCERQTHIPDFQEKFQLFLRWLEQLRAKPRDAQKCTEIDRERIRLFPMMSETPAERRARWCVESHAELLTEPEKVA